MKNIINIQTLLLLAFFITLPFFLFTQEEDKEKKVKVKTIKIVDGKKEVRDTTFTVTEDDQVKKVVKMYTEGADGDSAAQVMVEVIIDAEGDHEWHSDDNKVIIMHHGDDDEEFTWAPHGGSSKVMKFKSDDGEEKVIIIKPHGGHKVIKFKSDDGEVYEFDYDYDIDMESLNEEMAELNAEMKEMEIKIMSEHGNIHKEMMELRELEELEHLKELEVIVVPPAPYSPHMDHHDFTWVHEDRGMEVSDEELRDAGVKNKPDRLEIDKIDVDVEEGVVDLSFSMKEEGNPKVDVYNIYGDKVFSGKPELMNEKYQIKMDLSKKQYGTYYMQIISGSSSKTLRLKL